MYSSISPRRGAGRQRDLLHTKVFRLPSSHALDGGATALHLPNRDHHVFSIYSNNVYVMYVREPHSGPGGRDLGGLPRRNQITEFMHEVFDSSDRHSFVWNLANYVDAGSTAKEHVEIYLRVTHP